MKRFLIRSLSFLLCFACLLSLLTISLPVSAAEIIGEEFPLTFGKVYPDRAMTSIGWDYDEYTFSLDRTSRITFKVTIMYMVTDDLQLYVKKNGYEVDYESMNIQELLAPTAHTKGKYQYTIVYLLEPGDYSFIVFEDSTSHVNYSFTANKANAVAPQPQKPVVKVSTTSENPSIKWAKPDFAVEYNIYRATSSGGPYEYINTISETQYTDTAAKAGKTYYYRVQAVNENGVTSAYSTAVSVTYPGMAECEHDWKQATCTEPKTCKTCSATEGDALGHVWKAATCTEPKICKTCSATEGEALGHVWKAATCTEPKTCKTCGATEGEVVGHVWKDATCTDPKTCKTCEKTDGKAMGHEMDEWSSYETGLERRDCKKCDFYETREVAQKELSAPKVTAKNTASTGKVKLSWKAVDGAEKYIVYRATSKSGTYKKLKTTTSLAYTDSSAKVGTTYYYKVKAVGASGDNNATSSIVKGVRDLARPSVTVKNTASSGKVKLSWKEIDGAEKYVVYRATSKNGEYKKLKTTTKTAYTDSSAKVGKTYYYKVIAVHEKSAANSAYSKVVSAVRDLVQPDVTVKLKSNGDPQVSWEKVSGAEKYIVYRATSKSGEYKKLKTTSKLAYADTSAKAGKTYYYKVKAIHKASAANSAYSAVVKAKAK